ncbi:hypothetical protein TRFO_28705 [Tritrichomonas foetus]|uniref:Uncharacterized protein n=1 Tax=Tritrichomonas foetus TaxID=1144522 RepID=A0A1J4JXP8_9EUKA|nr:hypothetical protein TRFO_28705 [Tritrichomonas foetus]|eukprot:OHT03927.1 hypothetical protein TRFO_28705 [Tritrichomonas foetus]
MLSFFIFPLIIQCATFIPTCRTAEEDAKISARTEFKKGERIKIYVELLKNNVSVGRARYYPKVDELAILQVPSASVASNENSTVQITVKGITSKQHPLRKADYIVEFLSFLTYFDKGKLNGVGWDTSFDTNSCKLRDGIIDKTCGVPYNENNTQYLKVFVGYVGTDIDATPLKSAQSMPSTFVKFGVGGIIDDATKFVNKAIDWFKGL